jgi:8-oxo-dGTP diphosphatase / 2-hydroxy-dATP diphosphatase
MRPEWFSTTDTPSLEISPTTEADLPPIPYNSMWPDDAYWMPLLLTNRPFIGRADFDTDTSGKYKMLRWWFGVPSA